ncbi:MAG: 4-(cytidine 5'-diphospho)-2-C-methyl-D-erythritol kinase [Candidatus Symbiothrix sp.]|jgi:4-diphosphocytidyl-2-C-methyl-D-erythritol kinase|nr:4-(cytidine 5'-diphospho)-2-C-methyl-D-erythritol kinase [Candidatus Symbiothrix sp.]
MITFPNAKINLGLTVVSRRPDGYHNIETVFYPVKLCDALEIVPAPEGKTTFTASGIPVGGNPDNNLVMKAFHLLKKEYDLPEIAIYLRKNIPFGAGLGGGSSDAAFMLKLLNDFAALHLSDGQLEACAARIGSDCPFFIQNKPVFAEGTGNIFTPINLSLSEYYIVLVKPDIAVSTREAYAKLHPAPADFPVAEVIRRPVNEWKGLLVNDFEKSVFARHPEIAAIKEQLYGRGAIYASLSGSGSTVFGIFEQPEQFDRIFPDCSCHTIHNL